VVEETTSPRKERSWRVHGQDFGQLRAKIAARRAGWFSVRCYDAQDDLIESLPFRFAASLERLEIESPSQDALPGPNGHEETIARIIHDDRARISLAGTTTAVRLERAAWGTLVRIHPVPDGDRTRWRLEAERGVVEFSVRVDRIWWAIARESMPENRLEWTAVPASLRRDDLAAASSRVLHVRLPGTEWAASAGVREESTLPMKSSKESSVWSLALRNLTDRRELETAGAVPLVVVVERPGSRSRSAVEVGRIAAPERPPRQGRRIDTAALDPARAMTVLTRVARLRRSPVRRAILRFRKEAYGTARARRPARSEEFVRAALCLLDVLLDRYDVPADAVPRRWRERARAARDAFPDVSEAVEDRLARAMDEPS